MATTWTDDDILYVLPMNFCKHISQSTHGKEMVWRFGDKQTQTNMILVKGGVFTNNKTGRKISCYKETIKNSNYKNDQIIYYVDLKTFEKWSTWCNLKATIVYKKQKNHIGAGRFDLLCFDTEMYDNLCNLSK